MAIYAISDDGKYTLGLHTVTTLGDTSSIVARRCQVVKLPDRFAYSNNTLARNWRYSHTQHRYRRDT
jgi:hypothetical protein